jgi:adenylate cyclase
MSDVFISYARSSEEQALQVEQTLRDAGYSVWRDADLPAHRTYAEVIEERLKCAKAVVVLWSADATKSQWVRAEADSARELGTLIQASVDDTVPPMPFNQIQCADLRNWSGDRDAAAWRKVMASIAALAGPENETAPSEEGHARQRERAVCVLPFVNMSGDPEQEYFSDGISEDITTDLSKVSALEVTARNTAFMFKGQAIDVSDVAQKLGVSHVLEGSVRKAGTRVRINAQLIDGRTGGHVWAERYDRDLTDIFAIQDEITKEIVSALKLKLLPEEKKAIETRGTSSPAAYNFYLLARKYWITGHWGDVRQLELVIRVCQRALELDPSYGRAWGLLAIVQCILFYTFSVGSDDGLAAAERALSLDSNIAEAYCVRARSFHEQGELERADEALTQALKLEPDSWEVNREAARIYYFQRRLDAAVRHYEKAVEIDENDYHSWGMLASAYEALGNRDRLLHAARMVVTRSERVIAQDPTNASALGTGAAGLAILGELDRFDEWVDRALLLSPDNQIMRYNFACAIAVYFKDKERALDLLEPVFEWQPSNMLRNIVTDPDLDRLRGEPRFQKILDIAQRRMLADGVAPPIPVATLARPLS